ncbi:MAG TPA: flagellar export protein FliJ [Syntrophorhabdaceae bacterium]|nr:flagellar export protein FliJ [Syntrophorhabdaceae bacterium]
MAKFRFHKLIEIKESMLDDKKKDLKKTIDLYESISIEIIDTEDSIRKNFNRISEPDIDSNDIFVLREHIIWLETKKQKLLEEREVILKKIEALRSELEEIWKEIKMLDTLKNKTLQAMRKAENKKEQKKLDELALRIGSDR